MPRRAAVLLLTALPGALAISSLTYEYASNAVDEDYESHIGHASHGHAMELTNIHTFAHHAYVVSESSWTGDGLDHTHSGENARHEPEDLCAPDGPHACQHDVLYSHNEGPLFLGMAGGQRFVPLLWADLPTGAEYGGSRKEVPVRVTHVGLSCLELEKIDYEGTAYVVPIDVSWGTPGKGATSYAEFFPEPSVEDVLTRAVGLINKRSDDDTYDFSDQFQVCALSDEKRFRLEPATPRKGAASGGFSLSPSLSLSHARARARALSLSLSRVRPPSARCAGQLSAPLLLLVPCPARPRARARPRR